MSEQYFARDPSCASRETPCAFAYRGAGLRFDTDAGVFSRGELDPGTRLLLDALPAMTGDVLDLGCGWGAMGVAIARANPGCHVVMADVNTRALALAARNAKANGAVCETVESDGLTKLTGRRFSAVVTNPPIRAGKRVIYRLFADAAQAVGDTGALYLVIRKQQGADSCEKYLRTIYGQVDTLKKSGGYRVFRAAGPL